jgi:hypothetical protein
MWNIKLELAALVAAGSLLASSPALIAEGHQQGEGQAVVTILPGQEIPGGISQDALHVKIDGKDSSVTGWKQLRSPAEIVVLIDDGARSSLGTQLSGIAKFIGQLPPATKVAVAYMQNGRAVFSTPLTADHAAAAHAVHLPMAGSGGISASPYFCLSDLAKHWPSTDAQARREVVMITDGVDNYEPRYDPNDPYVQAAIDDAVRARLIVYSIYWRAQGGFDNTAYAADSGQSLLAELTVATGGNSYWQGNGDPVNIEPYLADIVRRLDSQYELDFMTPAGAKPQMQSLKLKIGVHAKVDAPQQVYVHPGAEIE